jgi:acetyl esterase/lipase
MRNKIKKLDNFLTVKNVSYASLILNITSIIFGIIYLAIETYNIAWDIFGIILLITLFGNILLVYLNTVKLNKTTKIGNRLNLLSYIYLFFMIFAIIFILGSNFILQIYYSNNPIDRIWAILFQYIGYFGTLVFATIIAYFNIKNITNRELWDLKNRGSLTQSKKTLKAKKILKIILGYFCINLLILGIYFVFLIFFGDLMGIGPITESNYQVDFTQHIDITFDRFIKALALLSGAVGVIVAQFALFFAIIFLSATVLLLKMINKKRKPKTYYGIAMLGLVISGVNLLPLCFTPYYIITAEQSFADAFGDDWRSKIDPDIEKYFLPTPFSLPGYFLGSRPKDCKVSPNNLYFNGSISSIPEDKNIRLYFDVYWPKGDRTGLPGKNSIIIFIHGGGWMLLDKGIYRVHLNKYLAAQGYIVYDIQYGLLNLPFNVEAPVTPKYTIGDFDINDQIRHIGNFTHYIAEAANKFSASELGGNLSSMFIQGMSAGGHLTCTTALAIASNNYTNFFSTAINVKGYVPYYPGNGIPDTMMMGGDDELINPEKLVNGSSPPALIFQGLSDGLSTPQIAIRFKGAYEANNNKKCAIIWFPLAGHGSDAYFTGYYNQIFTYYMERFLYLRVNDLI